MVISINEGTNMGMKIKTISVMSLICFTIVLVIQTSLATASTIWVYPVGTPVTTHDPAYHYSELTVDVSPKYMVIKEGEEQTWMVILKVEVLSDGKIDYIEIWIRLKSSEGVPDMDTNLLEPEIDVPDDSEFTGPNSDHDGWYLLEVSAESGSSFEYGDEVTVEFWVESPDTLIPISDHHELVKAYHRTRGPGLAGQESTSDYDIQVIFDVGPEFVIPELPLGTISAISIPLITLGIVSRARANKKKPKTL